jgi:hypothetical protein
MPTLKISQTGDVQVITPDGRPLVTAEMPQMQEVLLPHHILQQLETIDLRTANDLRNRMNAAPALKELFGSERRAAPVHKTPTKPRPLVPQYAQIQFDAA